MQIHVIKGDEKRVTSELSVEAKLLYERLVKCEVGDIVPYAELSNIAGRDVRQRARGAMMTARRKVEREDRLVFGVVRSVGVKCLSDSQIIGAQQAKIDHVRRTVSRSSRQLKCVRDYSQLSRDEQIRHNAYLSIAGMIAHSTSGRQVKRIESRVADLGRVLPLGHLLEELRK